MENYRWKHGRRKTGLRQSGTPNWEARSAVQYRGKPVPRAARSDALFPVWANLRFARSQCLPDAVCLIAL